MALNVNVKKKEKQSSMDLLKQFTKLVKSSGVVNKLKSIRYYERDGSDFKKKAAALKKIEKTATNDRLRKLGKKVER
ncbi:MAG TPA: 30S ribosomal protein S21 [Candidatus Pacebacteria bacterium]|nr:30S ribosomal protein S21 [Candidatus Paceibacterota bacterium]HIP33497.1 30S ribosomal protein S21 [Bacteroidia bacterium]